VSYFQEYFHSLSGVEMQLQTFCVVLQHKVSLARRLIESGSRPRGRDTFLCSAKEKYPKERRPGCRLLPAFLAFAGGWRKGLLPLRQRAASLPHPCGLFPAKAPVLGAADGIELVVQASLLRLRTALLLYKSVFVLFYAARSSLYTSLFKNVIWGYMLESRDWMPE